MRIRIGDGDKFTLEVWPCGYDARRSTKGCGLAAINPDARGTGQDGIEQAVQLMKAAMRSVDCEAGSA